MHPRPAVPVPQVSSHLVAIPDNFRAFRSIRSNTSPFDMLVQFLARELNAPGLQHPDVAINGADFAALFVQTRYWLEARKDSSPPTDWSRPGVTAPLIGKACPRGFAVVQTGGAA